MSIHTTNIYSQMFTSILLVGLLVFPLIHYPASPIPYEIPRVYFFYGWSLGLFIVAFLKKRHIDATSLVWILGIYAFIVIFSSFLGVDKLKSLQGNYYRRDGLITLYFSIMFAVSLALGWQDNLQTKLAKVVAFTTTALSLVIVWQGLRLPVNTNAAATALHEGIGWVFGNPNFLAGYILVSVPLALYGIRCVFPHKLFISGTACVLFGSAIYFTHSRASLLLYIVFLLYLLSRIFPQKLRILIMVLLITSSLLFCVLIISRDTGDMITTMVAESRERIYRKMVLGWSQRPLFGYGWANADAAFTAAVWPYPMRFDVYVDKAHGHALEHLVTTGIVGFIAYSTLLIAMSKTFFQKIKTHEKSAQQFWLAVLATFGLFVLHSQTNVISIAEEMYFWLCLGLLLASSKPLNSFDS